METTQFYRDFVERTKYELCRYEGEYEFTMLLNLAFGLLLVPFETQKSETTLSLIWDKSPEEVFDDEAYTLTTFEPIHRWRSGGFEYYDKTVGNLLRKLRHGLAHAHLEPVSRDGNWHAVKIWNCFETWTEEKALQLNLVRCASNDERDGTQSTKVIDFKIELTWEQLRKFAIRIADEHLKYYDQVEK